ncbi:UNVERIFIED_CONTAM: hypothetical protein HDU68_007809 [Siphonaria sp. JEL0065]|nr:hypothetical protein HDU68_007809 [Siphonaria sp. JEL0065]
MELLGHGFSLPIEDVVIVNECINVYKAWLLEGGDSAIVPPGSRGYEQLFWQTIFMHSSLLFQPRKSYDSANFSPVSNQQQQTQEVLTSEALVSTHINLCRHILLMILTAAQQQANGSPHASSNSNPVNSQQPYHLDFSRETWIVLLKVLLSSADRLLTEPSLAVKSRRGSYIDSSMNSGGTPVSEKPVTSRWGKLGGTSDRDRSSTGDVTPGPTMGDALCDFLSKVLIEVWLRSEEMGVELWACLKNQYEKWTHRVEIVRNWSAVTLALSNRVIQLLYGEKEGTKYTSISFPSSPTFNLDLSEKFTVYAWHRFTYIIGNVNNIESSENFYVAIKGISRVVDSFLLVGTRREFHPDVNAPDGNTLLHMFGPWLFEAVTRKSPELSRSFFV